MRMKTRWSKNLRDAAEAIIKEKYIATQAYLKKQKKSQRGAKYTTLKIFHFGMWIILSWRQSRSSRLRKCFFPPSQLPERNEKEGLYQEEIRDAYSITFLYLRLICVEGQICVYKHLLFLLPSELLSSPLKHQTLFLSLAQDGLWASVAWLPLDLISLWGSLKKWTFSALNLSLFLGGS